MKVPRTILRGFGTKIFYTGRRVSSFDEFRMIRGFGFSIDDDREPGLFFNEDGTDTLSFTKFKESFSFYNEGGINPYTCSSSFFGCSPVQMIPCLKIVRATIFRIRA